MRMCTNDDVITEVYFPVNLRPPFYFPIHHNFVCLILLPSMRTFSRLLATATDAGASKPFRPAPLALLPPIPLYRRILRVHRKKLPLEERLMGDLYVKSEFKAHKDIDNPVQIVWTSPESRQTCD